MPFHEQFGDKVTAIQKLQFFAKTIPTLVKSTGKVFTEKKEWPPAYHIAVEGIKGLLKEISTEPNVALIQELSLKPQPLPRKAKLTLDSIHTNQAVIDYISQKVDFESNSSFEITEIPGEWIDSTSTHQDYNNRIVYELHGGAYCLGSAGMYRKIHYMISRDANCRVFGLNYRLAPQHPFPCALIDAVSGYLELKKRYPNSRIVLQGDSAGGGLVIATLLCLRDMKKDGFEFDMPVGAFCMSPWVDLTHSFPSFHSGQFDFLPLGIVDSRLGDRKHYYTTNGLLNHPYVSPYFAKTFEGLPPILVTTGDVEKLYDEIIEICTRLPTRQVEVYHNHVHVFQMFPVADAASLSLHRAAVFYEKCFTGQPIESCDIQYDFKGMEVGSESL